MNEERGNPDSPDKASTWWRKQRQSWMRLKSDDGALSWFARISLYALFLGLAIFTCWMFVYTLQQSDLLYSLRKIGDHFPTVVLATVFGLILGTARFIIKTHDDKKQFSDSFNQQQEQELTRALDRLSIKEDTFSQSLGLRLLGQIRNRSGTSDVMKDEIDAITPGITIPDAKLSNAKLRGMNLENAGLERANLIGAKLQGTNLTGTNLRAARLEKSGFVRGKSGKFLGPCIRPRGYSGATTGTRPWLGCRTGRDKCHRDGFARCLL